MERQIGGRGRHDGLDPRIETLQRTAVAVIDLGDEVGLGQLTEIGDGRIGADQIDEANPEGTQCE